MKPTLLVLAAGMGSRYGGLKQLDEVGPNGETIMDFSVYDAIRAGFGKVVFVIRESFAEDFKAKVTPKFEDKIEVAFAFQAVNTPIEGVNDLPEREKPWGTAHAVLVAEDQIDGPFAVINADDYYGVEAFDKISKFLQQDVDEKTWAMVGFRLDKTISDNGSVSRGVAAMDNDNYMTDIVETHKIERKADGVIRSEDGSALPDNTLVSMNLWGFDTNFFSIGKKMFIDFVKDNMENPRAEFYIPLVVNEQVAAGNCKCLVLDSEDQWYGVTYKEDKEMVMKGLKKLTTNGVYDNPLWGELV